MVVIEDTQRVCVGGHLKSSAEKARDLCMFWGICGFLVFGVQLAGVMFDPCR